jgi:catechol 2,3-dioxygenase-like lactoylglutathione lyase family enzyme
MIDHVGFSVSDYARAKAFYEKALAPLGYALVKEVTAQETGQPAAGFGSGGKPDFWIGGEGQAGEAGPYRNRRKRSPDVGRVLSRRARCRRKGQRSSRPSRALSSELLRCFCPRSRWTQYRGGLSFAGLTSPA